MAYSRDLRGRLIRAVGRGLSVRPQGKVFEISPSTAVKWMQAYRREGRPDPKPHAGGRRSPLESHADWLKARVAAKADITLLELCAELAGRGVVTSKSAVARFFERIGSSFKKNLRATKQTRPDVAAAREAWQGAQALLDPERLVFVDETGTSTAMARLYGRGFRGLRLIGRVPHGHVWTPPLMQEESANKGWA